MDEMEIEYTLRSDDDVGVEDDDEETEYKRAMAQAIAASRAEYIEGTHEFAAAGPSSSYGNADPGRASWPTQSYGSSESVYNPYDPFSSKEYIAQEVDAGRMGPQGEVQCRSEDDIIDGKRPYSNRYRHASGFQNQRVDPALIRNFPTRTTRDLQASSAAAEGSMPQFSRATLGLANPENDSSRQGPNALAGHTRQSVELAHPDLQPLFQRHTTNPSISAASVPELGLLSASTTDVGPRNPSGDELYQDLGLRISQHGVVTLGKHSRRADRVLWSNPPSSASPLAGWDARAAEFPPSDLHVNSRPLEPFQTSVNHTGPNSVSSYFEENRPNRRSEQIGTTVRRNNSDRLSNGPSLAAHHSQIVQGTATNSSHHARKRRRIDQPYQEIAPSLRLPTSGSLPFPGAGQVIGTEPNRPPRRSLQTSTMTLLPHAGITTSPLNSVLSQMMGSRRQQTPLPTTVGLNTYTQFAPELYTPTTNTSWSFLPRLELLCTPHLVFTSELIPRSFDAQKRLQILSIFRGKCTYVPACVMMALGTPSFQYHLSDADDQGALSEGHRDVLSAIENDQPVAADGKGCPLNKIPVEIFQNVAANLTIETLKLLRLVSREFEQKLSPVVFRQVVVPFRSRTFGTVLPQGDPGFVRDKGKGKAREVCASEITDKEKIHDGINIFRAWGRHIRKFAMAFEVTEDDLAEPRFKGLFEEIAAFWGRFKWPHPYYSRFLACAGLETQADEHQCMSAAFSVLEVVKELGLSVDSGLGWLNGPDVAGPTQPVLPKPKIFGARTDTELAQLEAGDRRARAVVERATICRANIALEPNEHGMFEVDLQAKKKPVQEKTYVIPNQLTQLQKEWLLESEWAQSAFLASYCVAVIDSSTTFAAVTSFTVGKLSSHFLSMLQRHDFWLALPQLEDLNITISADFREMQKDVAGIVKDVAVQPSKAADKLFFFLNYYIAPLQHLKRLNVGYYGGSESHTGIFGRNQNILPAPMTSSDQGMSIRSDESCKVLTLPYIEHLKLVNCWVAPNTLKTFVRKCAPLIRSLILESVSLTGHANIGDPAGLVPFEGNDSSTRNPRLGNDPLMQAFFHQRDAASAKRSLAVQAVCTDPLTSPENWITNGYHFNSWPEVIDAITPGPTMDLIRYAFGCADEAPLRTSNPGSLTRIDFISCGYVRLLDNEDVEDSRLGRVFGWRCNVSLKKLFLERKDPLLGLIVNDLNADDQDCLFNGWLMTPSSMLENNEGYTGDGRFSGYVEKLEYEAED